MRQTPSIVLAAASPLCAAPAHADDRDMATARLCADAITECHDSAPISVGATG